MNMKNNVHLVPVVVLDTVDMLSDPRRGQNEKDQLRLRLLAIRDYCDAAIKKHETPNITETFSRKRKR